MPGGSFESGSPSWTLSGGAKLVSGNERFDVVPGTRSLYLPSGATATSPTMCFTFGDWHARFFARNSGNTSANLDVDILVPSLLGVVSVLDGGSVRADGTWDPSPRIERAAHERGRPARPTRAVSFRLKASGTGAAFQVDDVFLDPFAAASPSAVARLPPMQSSLPVAERPRRPEWMKVRAPSADGRYAEVRDLIHGQKLHTICEEARCPNIAECWGRGTATFQILGETCTRACRYCFVHSGRPTEPPDPLEPLRLAHAAAQMGLKHVVITSVDRDDVPDRGAGHYAATIRALKKKLPEASIEVLTPDFLGVEEEALRIVLGARPEVFNHNIETVRRLHRKMRGAKADYDKALWLLARAKEIADYNVLTKSGIIVGLGETNDEVVETMRDLRANGVDVVTIGQYLQPSAKHAAIDRWVHPDEFRWFREQGEALGFGSVFSGPLVRSSYRADEQVHAAETGRGAVAY